MKAERHLTHFYNHPCELRTVLKLSLCNTVGMLLSIGVNADDSLPTQTQDTKISEAQIKERYRSDRVVCKTMSGHTKEICIAEAKGREKISKAELVDRKANSEKSRYDVLMTKALVNFEIAEERCDALGGNAKNTCLNHAQAAIIAAKANAEIQILSPLTAHKAEDKPIQAPRNAIEKATEVSTAQSQ